MIRTGHRPRWAHTIFLAFAIPLLAIAGVACGEDDEDGDELNLPGAIEVAPAEGRALLVTGRDFRANSNVLVYLHSTGAAEGRRVLLTEVSTNADGEFSETVQVPDRWPDGSPITPQRLLLLAVSGDEPTRADLRYVGSLLFEFALPGVATPPATETPISVNQLQAKLVQNVVGLDARDLMEVRVDGNQLVITTRLDDAQRNLAARICTTAALTDLSVSPSTVVVNGRENRRLADCPYLS